MSVPPLSDPGTGVSDEATPEYGWPPEPSIAGGGRQDTEAIGGHSRRRRRCPRLFGGRPQKGERRSERDGGRPPGVEGSQRSLQPPRPSLLGEPGSSRRGPVP